MFGWFKKKPKTILIREEHVIEILDLVNAYEQTNSLKDKYAMWSRIKELYPEVCGKKMSLAMVRGELILEEEL